uniref:VTT domain-containing protein n=1 Tax=Ignisphaera aggregans TaxID=334771 RepID=A0A7J3QET6_9CREN
MPLKKDVIKIIESYITILTLIVISIIIFSMRKYIIRLLLGFNGFIAVFLLSLIGCLSIVPIPYTYILFLIAMHYELNPIIVSLGGAFGSTLGETIAWLLGRASSSMLRDTKYFKRIEIIIKFTKSHGSIALPILTFIFALTPLPDKILFLPLGVVRYSVLRILPAAFLGKMLMNIIIIITAQTWGVIGEEVLGLDEILMFIVTTAMLIIIMSIIMFIKWEKILGIQIS